MNVTKTLTAALLFGALSLSAVLVIANNHPMLGKGAPCAGMDTDGNGSIDEQEFNTMREQRRTAAPTFSQIDTNGDGLITTDEMVAMHQQRKGDCGMSNCGKSMNRGHHGKETGMMGNRGSGCRGQAMDAETKEQHDAFMAATTELRKEIAVKRAEKRAVMQATNPNPDQAAQLTRELLELRAQMMATAEEAGVDFGPGNGYPKGRGGQGHAGKGGCGGGCR